MTHEKTIDNIDKLLEILNSMQNPREILNALAVLAEPGIEESEDGSEEG